MTPTEPAYLLPDIPEDQAPLARAIVFRSPANLRAGPATDFPPVAQLTYGVAVDLYGIIEAGDWVLLRVNQPGDPQSGTVGWIALDLLQVTGDLAFLPRYRDDGTPLVPPTPTFTPTPGTPTPTLTPTPTETPTPWATSVMQEPALEPLPAIVAPQPSAGEEIVFTIGGERIPAEPLAPIPAVRDDGQSWALTASAATVEIWTGLYGLFPAGWAPAPAELLWPGTLVYVTGAPAPDEPAHFVAERIRIVAAPVQERARLLHMPDLAAPLAEGSGVGMMGSRELPGVFLLETAGTLRQLWTEEREAGWANPDGRAGVLVQAQTVTAGLDRFSWVRGDGFGIQITAQPFLAVRGAVADDFGGLWWIEAAQADLDQWQLWHYEPRTGRMALRLRGTSDLLRSSSSPASVTLAPVLVGVQPRMNPTTGEVDAADLLLDSVDRSSGRLYMGLVRVGVRLSATGPGSVEAPAQLLLAPESYRGPLQVSPDATRLAFFAYDPGHDSLTSGFIRPANQLRILALAGPEVGTARTVYAAESRFEFLAPNVAWQGPAQLITARARFAPGETFGVERFGIVQVQLPGPEQAPENVVLRSYLFPNQRELRDFAPCLDGRYSLTVASLGDGTLELARWDGTDRPQPLFLLPDSMSRAFLCWQAPDSLLAAQ